MPQNGSKSFSQSLLYLGFGLSRDFWADITPFKGQQYRLVIQGYSRMCRASPRHHYGTTDANTKLDCGFIKKNTFSHSFLIVKSQQNRIELVTRPKSELNFVVVCSTGEARAWGGGEEAADPTLRLRPPDHRLPFQRQTTLGQQETSKGHTRRTRQNEGQNRGRTMQNTIPICCC